MRNRLETDALAAWVPFAIVASAGFTAAKSRWVGPAALVASCALSLTLFAIAESNVGYQRDDWRDLSRALGVAAGPRAIALVGYPYPDPLEVYRPQARTITSGSVRVSELDLVATATREHGGPGPAPTLAALSLPRRGFRLRWRQTGSTFVVLTYVATSARDVPLRVLRGEMPAMSSVLFEPTGARAGQPG